MDPKTNPAEPAEPAEAVRCRELHELILRGFVRIPGLVRARAGSWAAVAQFARDNLDTAFVPIFDFTKDGGTIAVAREASARFQGDLPRYSLGADNDQIADIHSAMDRAKRYIQGFGGAPLGFFPTDSVWQNTSVLFSRGSRNSPGVPPEAFVDQAGHTDSAPALDLRAHRLQPDGRLVFARPFNISVVVNAGPGEARVKVWGVRDKNAHEYVSLPNPGDAVLLRADCVHAGCVYEADNFRLFAETHTKDNDEKGVTFIQEERNAPVKLLQSTF